ncbi:hypothetical protein DMX11_18200 [Pseudomonas sp. LB-090624]|uniref:hypothetical protein n=1 Tax=Pseudomonas sp. LB-090624 TaxID=2213079 RepID=UPI000D91CE15|nr:hypothetical protein [Pseudomonas sp. LB-090624]PYB72707.1 hypothetical protein DMX11_18200 [Pseudomonas sp. LB-090624]
MLDSYTRTGLGAALLAAAFSAQASIGARTAEQMQNNYNATPAQCAGNAVPAHACSGVLLRSTKPSPHYHTWHHSQNSKDKGGVSFSYLRRDIPTTRLAADGRSGFTLYPLLQRPKGSLWYEMLCAWPTDGDSWERDTRGCGDNRQSAEVEAACHEQGVLTAEDWMARFSESGDYKRQCAFDVRRARVPERADAFYQSVRAKQLYAQRMPFPWNEIVIGTWDEANAEKLPIQSFFHIEGEHGALQQAQADQQDWHNTNGTFIPVIRIRLPDNLQENARFSYHEGDQAVPAP